MYRTGTRLNAGGPRGFRDDAGRDGERAHVPPGQTARVTDPVPTPPAPIDQLAAERLWGDYVAASAGTAAIGNEHPAERFGDSTELADELIELVLHGPKRATAGLVADFVAEGQPLPRIGGHWIACDGAGAPRAVLRSVQLRVGPVESVDDSFAYDEGEGERTRTDWLRSHRRYFTRVCAARGEQFSEADEVVFERFRVVWPPEVRD
jgi:uncharacterized protein YhfF